MSLCAAVFCPFKKDELTQYLRKIITYDIVPPLSIRDVTSPQKVNEQSFANERRVFAAEK